MRGVVTIIKQFSVDRQKLPPTWGFLNSMVQSNF
jgi:hypothetical protein